MCSIVPIEHTPAVMAQTLGSTATAARGEAGAAAARHSKAVAQAQGRSIAVLEDVVIGQLLTPRLSRTRTGCRFVNLLW